MPVVTVLQSPRDVDQRRDLVARITQAFVDAYSLPPETVSVWITETPTDAWGTAGRLAAD
jgi:4-oxalocrotonate tautomerase